MQNLVEIKRILQLHKMELMERYGLTSIGIFGSFSRGDQTDASDIDIMIEYNQPMGIGFIDLADELEQLLSSKVDLVSKNAVKPLAMQYIEKDIVYV